MTKVCLLLLVTISFQLYSQSTLITPGNNQPNITANSTLGGIAAPRVTSVQRDAIVNPTLGLLIYNITNGCLEVFRGNGWYNICTSAYAPNNFNELLGGESWESSLCTQKTTDGGYIIVGSSESSYSGDVWSTNNGNSDFWIVKLNENFTINWQKSYGGSGNETAYYVQQTSDNGYIITGFSNSSASGDVTSASHGDYDAWILKLDSNGNVSWQKLLGGSGADYCRHIKQTADGGYILAGYSTSSASGDITQASRGNYDIWVVKLNSAGNIVWNKLLGGIGNEYCMQIEATTDNGYIVFGYSSSSLSGDVTATSHGGSDFWVVKLDANGNIIWNKLLGGDQDEYAYKGQVTSDGGYILVGNTSSSANGNVSGQNRGIGNFDCWIVRLNSGGSIVWEKIWGGDQYEMGYSALQLADGGFIICGISGSSASGDIMGFNNGESDALILRLDSAGNEIWQRLFGGKKYESINTIVSSGDGGFVLSGYSSSSESGNVNVANHSIGQYDFWILKIDSSGNIK